MKCLALAWSVLLGACAAEDGSTDDMTAESHGSTDPTGPTGSGPMICQPSCQSATDCCPPPEDLPPGVSCPDDYPFNFVCPEGVCRPGGCTDDDDCRVGRVCIEARGVRLCRMVCASDEDCDAPQTCDGLASDGNGYCAFRATCSTDRDPCLGFGICVDGLCGCEVDNDCREDWGCTIDW